MMNDKKKHCSGCVDNFYNSTQMAAQSDGITMLDLPWEAVQNVIRVRWNDIEPLLNNYHVLTVNPLNVKCNEIAAHIADMHNERFAT